MSGKLSADAMKALFRNRARVAWKAERQAKPRPNVVIKENYSEVFLCHAKLYVFSEERDIVSLKKIALSELHGVLVEFNLWLERTADIAALVHYVYENTVCREAGEPLRELVAAYIGTEMDVLIKDKAFKALVEELGGDLLDDFLAQVEKRI